MMILVSGYIGGYVGILTSVLLQMRNDGYVLTPGVYGECVFLSLFWPLFFAYKVLRLTGRVLLFSLFYIFSGEFRSIIHSRCYQDG